MLNNAHSSFSIAIFSVWICDFSWLPSFVVTDAAITCGGIGQILNIFWCIWCNLRLCRMTLHGQKARHAALRVCTGRDTPQARPRAAFDETKT
jgi:uncharacterized membrane protein YccF (DUF307 family)